MSATSTNGNQTAAADTCVICLDAISERAVTAPCQHDAFDYLCLLNWLEVRQSCPLCNASVEALDVVNKTLGRVVRHPVHPPKPPSPPPRRHHRHRARTPPTPSTDFAASAIQRRRHIYKHHLRSRHIGSNGHTRFRSATPQHFRRSPALVSRARTFLRRELHVFPWLDGDREYVLEYVTAILKCIDLRGAEGAAEDMIADFVGRRNAQVLVHELYAWVRSPFERLVQFDSFVQYGEVVEAPGVDRGGRKEETGERGAERGYGDSYRPRYSGLVE